MSMIEVVYSRYYCLYSEEFDTIGEALGYIEMESDNENLFPIGVYVDGKPIILNGYISQDPPTEPQEIEMIRIYKEVKDYDGPGAPSTK
jgi:hypothetical protein